MNAYDPLAELTLFCLGARLFTEAGHRYVDLPGLSFTSDGQQVVRDALLGIDAHGGYLTRLFLSAPVPNKGGNWSTHVVLGRTWHTWSWNHVPATLRLAQILAEHLRALR
jgi:hypothetical protein